MAVPKDVLDVFYKLSEGKEAVRINAAVKIVEHVKQSDENANNYILSRLIRGLASNRDSARQGFFIGLVEVIRQSEDEPEVIAEKIKKLVGEHLKHEEGEFLCGQLFCLGAMLRSGRVGETLAAGMIKEIMDLSKKKSYLLIAGYNFIVDYITKLASDAFISKIWPTIRDGHDWKAQSWSLETLWILLSVHDSHPKALNKSFMLENFGRKKLVTEELCEIATKSKEDSTIPIHVLKKHPVHNLFIKALMKENLLDTFWQKHIDPTLSKSSSYKTMMAFEMLDLIVDALEDKNQAPKFLTVNVVETALALLSRIESAPSEDKVIFGLLAKFTAVAKDNHTVQKALLKSLLTHPGNIAFDKVTGGNVVQQLISSSSKESVVYVGTLYRRAVLGQPDGGHQRTAQERVFACHQLAKLVGHAAMQDEQEWRVDTLNFLLACSLFDIKTEVKPLTSVPLPFSREARGEIKETFFKALDFKAKNFEQICAILKEVSGFANSLLAKTSAFVPLSSKTKEAWNAMLNTVNSIEKSKKKNLRKEDTVFQMLFLHMGFQLFSEPDMACDILADLKQCYERATQKASKKKKSSNSEEEPLWVEVVVDLLLSLLSQNKHVLRQLSNSVFSMLCPHLTSEALQAILDVVKPPAKETEADDEESDEEWEDVKEEEENGEEVEDESAEEDSEDSDEEESDANSDEENVENLQEKLKSALGPHGGDESDDENDVDMDDISEEDMKKLDDALANVFRQLSGKKGRQVEKKEQKDVLALIHFKTRALDLIDVYLNHQPAMSHIILIMETVMSALEIAGKKKEEKPLETRLKNTLKKITNLKKPTQFKLDAELDTEMFVEALKSLVELASKGSPLMPLLNNPIPLYSQCCTLILKMSQVVDDDDLSKKIDQVYEQAMEDFLKKAHCLLPVTFFSLPMQGNWKGSWPLADKLITYGFNSKIRQFRRTHALTLLGILFHNRNLQDSETEGLRNASAKQLEDLVIEELKTQGKDDVKPRYLCELLGLLHGLFIAKANLDWVRLAKALEEFRENVPKNRHFQDVKKAFNKIGVLLKIKVVQGSEKKRKLSASEEIRTEDEPRLGKKKKQSATTNGTGGVESMEVEETANAATTEKKKKKKKKHKHNKDGLEKKKQSKLHAIDGQFQGMEMPSFSGLALTDNMNFVSSEKGKMTKASKKIASKANNNETAKTTKKIASKAENGETTPGKKKMKINGVAH